MFALDKVDAVLEHVNIRVEMAGDETTPAADLKFSADFSNDILTELASGLKEALYGKAGGADRDLVSEHHLPSLKFKEIEQPLALTTQLIGANVTIHVGISGASDIDLAMCSVNKFVATCQDGGSVTLGLRVQCHPTPEQVAILYKFQRETVLLSVIPPSVQVEARKPKKKKSEPDAQVPLELEGAKPVPAPEGGWPFGTKDEKSDADAIKAGALKALAAAGYSVTTGEIERWTKAEVAEAIAYAEKLHNLKGKREPPKAPDILRGRPRHNRPTSVTRH